VIEVWACTKIPELKLDPATEEGLKRYATFETFKYSKTYQPGNYQESCAWLHGMDPTHPRFPMMSLIEKISGWQVAAIRKIAELYRQ
jgi:hypothetical protein